MNPVNTNDSFTDLLSTYSAEGLYQILQRWWKEHPNTVVESIQYQASGVGYSCLIVYRKGSGNYEV